MENNENIVKVGLSQSLRERVTFETFATDEQKADHKMLKEEPLKEKFRHIWFVGFCNLVDSCNQSNLELTISAMRFANKNKIFSARLKDAGYVTLAHKINNSSGSYLLDNNITEEDLR